MNAGMIVCSGRLRGASTFGCAAIEREQRAAILQRKSGALGDDARSEAGEVALDERHHVAVAIGRAEIRRVARVHAAATPAGDRSRLRGSDRSASPARAREFLAQHRGHRHIGKPRIGDVPLHVGIRQLLRFDHRCAARRRSCAPYSPSGNASRMFSIISAAMPAPFGGISKTSHPR